MFEKDLERNISKLPELYKRMMLFVAETFILSLLAKSTHGRLTEFIAFVFCVYFVFIVECCYSAKLPPSSFVTESAIWGERHSVPHSPPIRWICRSPQILLAVASQYSSRHLDDPKGEQVIVICLLIVANCHLGVSYYAVLLSE